MSVKGVNAVTKRAVVYARVCVDDGKNLAGQLEMSRKHATQHGWQVVAELAEVGPAGDGGLFALPQRKRLLEMATAGQFDVLIIRELTRLSRSCTALLIIRETLDQQGIQIECIEGKVGR